MTTPKLVGRSEEIVTNTLGHILSSSEASRQALRDFLLTRDVDIGEITRIETQNLGRRGGGTPDLAAYDETGKERLLLEAKFWAGLTSNQPVTYLRRLPKEGASALLVVAPPVRLEELWQQLQSRVSAEDGLAPRNKIVEPEIRWCDVGEHRKMILTSWRFLLDSIAAQASSAVAQTVNDIHQLQGMAELRGLDPSRRDPLNPEFPRSLPLLYALIDDTVERLIERSLAEIPAGAYRPTIHSAYSVRYFTFCGVKSASFGIYFRDWRTYHHSPLWFTLHYNDLQNDMVDVLLKEPFNACRKGTHLYVPIHVQGGQYEVVLAALIEQISRIATLIEPSRTRPDAGPSENISRTEAS